MLSSESVLVGERAIMSNYIKKFANLHGRSANIYAKLQMIDLKFAKADIQFFYECNAMWITNCSILRPGHHFRQNSQ